MADAAMEPDPGHSPVESNAELPLEPVLEPAVVLSPAPPVGVSPSMGTDPSAQRRALCKAAWGESWTATCGHFVSLADLSNSCLQRICRQLRPSPTNMPDCQPCREQNGRQRPAVSLKPNVVAEPAPKRVPVSPHPKPPQRVPPPPPSILQRSPTPAAGRASPVAMVYQPWSSPTSAKQAPTSRYQPYSPMASSAVLAASVARYMAPHGNARVEHPADAPAAIPALLDQLPQRLPQLPTARTRVAVSLGGTGDMRLDAVLDLFAPFGVRADGFFRSPNGARDRVAVFDSLNAHFAANASAWDAVRNASATPWFIPRIVSGTDANRLVDQAVSQDIQRIWGHASANLWSVRHFWTLAKKAQLSSIVGIFLFELPTSSRPEVSILYRQPSRLPRLSVVSLLPHFGEDGFCTEHWDRGSWVSIVHVSPDVDASADDSTSSSDSDSESH